MISSQEATEIFKRWCSAHSVVKLVAMKPSGESGRVQIGNITAADQMNLRFVAEGNELLIPLDRTSFRKLGPQNVIQLSSMQAWDEGLELRWKDSGNCLIFLRLANKISHVADGQN